MPGQRPRSPSSQPARPLSDIERVPFSHRILDSNHTRKIPCHRGGRKDVAAFYEYLDPFFDWERNSFETRRGTWL
ncbi:hypothetical protein JMJ77_0008011 [Colletotrichum scovillei]|uniref:Uncharacterized protein n=1 Tax=Colletotrichum scovillei TaxID=1209932 RepID=A0A9P7UH47_9PEZI|nr:hypothetical protein JMJ77_0008011 [Colletotrichum scovillei]KAG7074989.1 hypothetical protein JMJ76_0011454 [Colletotrichum scovillei]KAG7082063.1 hypothetical protein JMJ78_0004168 [Colletotrichum scovillei]